MADATVTSANVRALQTTGAIVRHHDAGDDITVGYAVYIASDGDVEHADADTLAASRAIGILVETHDGETTASDGDGVTVCTFGPVAGFSDLTEGALYYVSQTAGRITATAPTSAYQRVIGYAETDKILFVWPGMEAPVSA